MHFISQPKNINPLDLLLVAVLLNRRECADDAADLRLSIRGALAPVSQQVRRADVVAQVVGRHYARVRCMPANEPRIREGGGRVRVVSPQAPASALVLHCLAPGAFGTAELAPGQEQWQSNWDMNCGVVVSTCRGTIRRSAVSRRRRAGLQALTSHVYPSCT